MRSTVLAGLAAAACVVAPALAQRPQPSQEQLVELRTAKLAKPVFAKADWKFDYDEARRLAAEQGKLIFVYFTRSYSG